MNKPLVTFPPHTRKVGSPGQQSDSYEGEARCSATGLRSRRARARPLTAIFFFLVCGRAVLFAQSRDVSWHHAQSPFRAIFSVQSKPTLPAAGAAVTVPVSGLGAPDGRDFRAFDQRGLQLDVNALGRGVANSAIAQVRLREKTKRIYVYFGSGGGARQNPDAFIPALTVDIRSIPKGDVGSWEEVKSLLENSRRLGRLFTEKISLSHNPVDATDRIAMVFDGYLNIPKTGSYTYFLVSDDAGYLFVEDQLLIRRDGRHWARDAQRGENRESIKLETGPRRIRCVVADAGGGQMAVVGQWITGRNKYALRAKDFVQAARTEFETVEPRYRDAPCPAFAFKHRSYMGLGENTFTETQFRTLNGDSARWAFEDGVVLEGTECIRLFAGLENRRVNVSRGRATARGRVTFPETTPTRLRIRNRGHFQRYQKLILEQDLTRLPLESLLSYRKLLTYRDYNPGAIPVCEAIAAHQAAAQTERHSALLDAARAASTVRPEKASDLYERILKQRTEKAMRTIAAREYAELLLFGKPDMKRADQVIRGLARHLSPEHVSVQLLLADLHLQRGDIEAARKRLQSLMASRDVVENQRRAAVRANALRERCQDLLERDFLIRAREKLWEWQKLAPHDRLDGTFALSRARLWQKMNWLQGALSELSAVVELNPLLPTLPDVEYDQAVLYREAGKQKEAETLFKKIADEYPNHPVSKRAAAMLEK